MNYQTMLQREQERALKQALKYNQTITTIQNQLSVLNQLRAVLQRINCYPELALNTAQYIISNNGRLTKAKIAEYYRTDQYLYNTIYPLEEPKVKLLVHIGRLINEPERIQKIPYNEQEIKLMFKLASLNQFNITVQHLKIDSYKSITNVPKYAIIGNFTESKFRQYNSSPQYQANNQLKLYEVESLSDTTGMLKIKVPLSSKVPCGVTFRTKGMKLEKPTKTEIEYGKYRPNEGKAYIEPKYFKLCNRYIILATLRQPSEENTIAYYKIIAVDGTTVYVVARLVPYNKVISSQGIKEQRIYYIGYNKNELIPKLQECKDILFQKLGGYSTQQLIAGKVKYTLLPAKNKDEYDA